MQSIVDFLYMVDDMLWGTPMVVIVLGTGIFLSLRFGFGVIFRGDISAEFYNIVK